MKKNNSKIKSISKDREINNKLNNSNMTLNNFKEKMIEKAQKRGGLWENFGQVELRKLKDKYNYNHYGSEKEREFAREIDRLDRWAANFDLSQLKKSESNPNNPNSPNMDKEIKELKKENKQFESAYRLESYLEGKGYLSQFYLIVEIIREAERGTYHTTEKASERMVDWWNDIMLKEEPPTLKSKSLGYFLIWHLKKEIAEAEKKETPLNPVTKTEVLEVKEWLDKIRKKHKIKGAIPEKVVLEELKLEKK